MDIFYFVSSLGSELGLHVSQDGDEYTFGDKYLLVIPSCYNMMFFYEKTGRQRPDLIAEADVESITFSNADALVKALGELIKLRSTRPETENKPNSDLDKFLLSLQANNVQTVSEHLVFSPRRSTAKLLHGQIPIFAEIYKRDNSKVSQIVVEFGKKKQGAYRKIYFHVPWSLDKSKTWENRSCASFIATFNNLLQTLPRA